MRELSSRMTFFYKCVFAPLWIGGFALGTLGMAMSPKTRADSLGFLLATVVGGAFMYWTVGRIKRVDLDGDCLVVSNYLKTVRIPLSDVAEVGRTLLLSPELAWLKLRSPSEFGEKIVFMPPVRMLGGFTTHPMVKELRGLLRFVGPN